MNARHSHIVTIRRDGVIEGHQLRIDGGGPGKSRYFSSRKHGSADHALRAARQAAEALGLPPARPMGARRGHRLVSRRNSSGVAGIRFEWVSAASAPILRVVATWQDRQGQPCRASYSVEHNGLAGALDLALVARTSCGAPMPDRAALLDRLEAVYRSQGDSPTGGA